MNIIVMGAGAIGSLFGALLSKKNNVVLIGRPHHVDAIQRKGLFLSGKTNMNVKIQAKNSLDDSYTRPDILLLTVKSYDTETAMKDAKPVIDKKTLIVSLQNGLDNIEKIEKIVNREQIIAGITTHGAVFNKSGIIQHTGQGDTVFGELNGKKTNRVQKIIHVFNEAGIKTRVSTNIFYDIWIKTIINSSINPITTFFQCKNGYLTENPILENIVEKICEESTIVANKEGMNISSKKMYKKTREVTKATDNNYSSMFQSVKKGKKTEIDSINGRILSISRKHGINSFMNEILFYIIKSSRGNLNNENIRN
jgi:2-dehydropantoate 2-reductase